MMEKHSILQAIIKKYSKEEIIKLSVQLKFGAYLTDNIQILIFKIQSVLLPNLYTKKRRRWDSNP